MPIDESTDFFVAGTNKYTTARTIRTSGSNRHIDLSRLSVSVVNELESPFGSLRIYWGDLCR